MTSLLPPNATALEEALAGLAARLIGVDARLDLAWSPERIPVAQLPWLAWALSVDEWDHEWPETTKRAVIAAAIEVHRHKGSRASVEQALNAADIGAVEITEGWSASVYDGTHLYDGAITHASSDHWAEYRVRLDRPITLQQAASTRRILARTAPARSHLKALDYQTAANRYDGAISYDGAFSHGVA